MVAVKTTPKTSANSARNKPPVIMPGHTDLEYCEALPLVDIRTWEKNPRKQFEEAGLLDLVESIRLHGLQQPIVVRWLPGEIERPYQIVMGERRFRAATMLGLETMPARIRVGLSDADAMVLAVTENCQRRDLSAIEEAMSFQALIDEGKTQQEVGDLLGMPQSTIANRLRLLALPEDVRDLVAQGKLGPSHAKALLRFAKFPAVLSRMAEIAIERGTPSKELETGMPFADELKQKKLLVPLDYNAKFPREGCQSCPHNAYFTGGSWPNQWCLRPDQYRIKDKAAREAEAETQRVALEQAKAQSERAQERLARLGVETPGVPPPPGASRDEDAQTANAIHKAEARLPLLSKLPHNTYMTVGGDCPPGCSEACECRIVALNHADSPVQVCMQPGKYNQLKGKETERKQAILRERFDAQRAEIFNLEQPGAEGDPQVGQIYHRVLCLALARDLWDMGGASRINAIRAWRYLDDPELIELLKKDRWQVKAGEAWPVLARQQMHALCQLALEIYAGIEMTASLARAVADTPWLDFILDRDPASEEKPDILKIVVDPPYQAASEAEKDVLFSKDGEDAYCERCRIPIPESELECPFATEQKQRDTQVLRLSSGVLVILRDGIESVYCAGCAKDEAICRVCGCTEHVPCEDEESGETCAWAEADLCTECVDLAPAELRELANGAFDHIDDVPAYVADIRGGGDGSPESIAEGVA